MKEPCWCLEEEHGAPEDSAVSAPTCVEELGRLNEEKEVQYVGHIREGEKLQKTSSGRNAYSDDIELCELQLGTWILF